MNLKVNPFDPNQFVITHRQGVCAFRFENNKVKCINSKINIEENPKIKYLDLDFISINKNQYILIVLDSNNTA